MNLSKYITFQNHHEGRVLPDTPISLGFSYYYDEPKKSSGFYFKLVLPEVKIKKIISQSTFEFVTCKCKHHFLFRIRKNKYSDKLIFNKYDAWYAI